MPIQTGAYYEGRTVREMIEDTRRWLGVNASDTNRYPDADVIRALNFSQNRFSKLTSCNSLPVIVILKSGIQNYRLPYGCQKILAARYYYGDDASSYYELEIVNNKKKLQRQNSQLLGQQGTPETLFPSYRFGNVATFGLTPIPSSDGTSWDGDDYGLLTSATEFSISGLISGNHKAGYSASAFLVDSEGRDLVTLGAKVGYPIFNTTDSSNGLITAIGDQDATNDKISVTLAGGTDNQWDTSDAWQIPMQEYGVVLDGETERYISNSYYGVVFEIAGGANNLVLDISKAPLAMSATYDQYYCEIPAEYHEAVIAGAVYWLGRSAFKGVEQGEKAVSALAIFNQYVLEYQAPDESAEESNKEIEDRSYEYLY